MQLRNIYFITFLLSSCSFFQNNDGPPAHDIDVTYIQDAKPKLAKLSKYGNPKQYTVLGKTYYVLKNANKFKQSGIASWYGTKFHGKLTSTREPYNMAAMTAAHKTLPLPCYVKVTRLDNHQSIVVKVNDRGPFVDNRIIDLSYAAAKKLQMLKTGTAQVKIEAVLPPFTDAIQVGAYNNFDTAKIQLTKLSRIIKDKILIQHKDNFYNLVVINPIDKSIIKLQKQNVQYFKL